MLNRKMFIPVMWIAVLTLCTSPASAQTPHVVSTSPAQNELNVPVSTNISVTFNVNMDETTINDSTFVVNARCTGLHLGTMTYDGPTKTLDSVAQLTRAAGYYPSGVPGVDLNGDIALGGEQSNQYIEVKLLV